MKVDVKKITERLEEIYQCGKHEDGSYGRLAFSTEDIKGREKFMGYFEDMGVTPRIDEAGNIIARLEGKDNSLPSILIGSHLDTVPGGGKYDGALGCVAGFGVMNAIVEAGYTLNHPLEIIVFTDEEGARFGSGLLGSSAFSSAKIEAADSDIDIHGRTRGDVFKEYGISVSGLEKAARQKDTVHCFLELHVEQGASLHRSGVPIGVVTSIAGVRRFEITVDGQPNHSGSTMMRDRKDALVAASRFISSVPDTVRDYGNEFSVATVGFIKVQPNSVNVVPGNCVFSLEIRDQDSQVIEKIEKELVGKLDSICKAADCEYSFKQLLSRPPAPMTDWVRDAAIAVCKREGIEYAEMPSGAFHDSLLTSSVFATGMIFIPSVGGISHSSLEYSLEADIERGCDILLQTVLEIDAK